MDEKKGVTGIFLSCLLLTGRDMTDYHPYDVKIKGERDINNKSIEKIEAKCLNKTVIRLIAMGDSQRWYDETVNFVSAVDKRNGIDFVMREGNLSDFGLTDGFLWQRNIMNKLNMSYVALIGNHDYLGTGEEAFRKIFGGTNLSFIAGRVRFVYLNINVMEYNYSDPIPDPNLTKAELTECSDEFNRTVSCMCTRPLCDQFNNNIAKILQVYIRQFPALQLCTAAHEHRINASDVSEDEVMYYGNNCIENRNYLVFTMRPEGYDYGVVGS